MNQNLARISKSIASVCLKLAFLLTPLFFLPLTTDFFSLQKQTLFLFLTAVALIAWLIYNLTTKTVRLTLSPMLLPLFLLSATTIVSALTNSPISLDIWANRPSLFVGLTVFYLLFTTLFQSPKDIKKLLNSFIIIASILAFWGILSILGIFESLPLTFLAAKNFSPTGSLLNLVTYLLISLPISLTLAFKAQPGPRKLSYFLSSGLIVSAIILVGYQLLPGQTFAVALLPKLAGWSIAVDTFKTHPLFGVGPTNFLNQFTQFRPLSLNQTNFWNIAFTASSNLYFHLITTLGLIGITVFGFLVFSWVKLKQRQPGTRITSTQMALNLALATSLLLGLFVPFTILTWILFVSFLSFTVITHKTKNLTKVKDVLITLSTLTLIEPLDTSTSQPKTQTRLLPWLIAVPAVLGLALTTANLSKIYAADYFFNRSLTAASQNQGKQTYDLQIKAIESAPNVDRFHTAYSNTNLALANSIASQGDLTDQNQQTISQLIQQAIREARTSTQLNPDKAANWLNLATIYRQLVNFADGADQFAQAAYIKAIQLDPSSPNLRLELGGLLYSQQQYQEAINRFQEAIQLKPDYANAYYNLANAYKENQQLLEAYQTMQQVISLIPADSPDFNQAQQELEALEAQLPQNQTTDQTNQEPEQLKQPETPPTPPAGFDKLDLEKLEPTPQPSPAASPSPQP